MRRMKYKFLLMLSIGVGLWFLPPAAIYGTTDLSQYGMLIKEKSYVSPYSGQTWTMRWFQVSDNPHDQQKLLFDTNEQPTSVAFMHHTEEQAFYTKHGTFDPQLDSLLTAYGLSDRIHVGIWYQSMEHRTLPINLHDGASLQLSSATPLGYTTLTKRDLLSLRNDLTIKRIYYNHNHLLSGSPTSILIDNPEKRQFIPDMYTSVRTQYINQLWSDGYTGQGRKIGIVETGKPRPITQLSITAVQPLCHSYGETEHATTVSSIAASIQEPKGVAPSASIIAACASGINEIEDALDWAFDNGADVANISLSFGEDTPIRQIPDAAVDYIARTQNKLVVVASGNSGEFVGSPGKAWNALTVGGYSDNDSLKWNDDAMLRAGMSFPGGFTLSKTSSFYNPESRLYDHEKPEIVATSVVTTYFDVGNAQNIFEGTSNAAPQVVHWLYCL